MVKRIDDTRAGKRLADLPVWGGSSQAIEESEAEGQTQLVQSESLPVDIRGGLKARLEAQGVVFGAPYPDDPLFLSAQLPQGWAKRATDHSMWSELINERGERVAVIFYKAAFYDRAAFMREGE